jgi:hypothetical protein
MKAITNNPYRILGVLAGANNREITRQANNLKKYITAGVELPVDFSFANLDNFQRTVEDIDDAIERNDTDPEKIENALFWFWKGNDITDESVFDLLKDGNIQTALNIWDKLITRTEEDGKRFWREVTEKNASAFHNFFVASYLTNKNINAHTAITAQLYFLESNYWQNFKIAVTDITFNSSKKELQLLFLNTLISEKVVGVDKMAEIIKKTNFVAKADFLKNIAKTIIEKITAQIDIAENKRKSNKANAAVAGENLYRQTQADLKQLKDIFGEQDFSYENVADKVANEILQCSIDFFNDSQKKNLENNYHERAEKLAKIAQGIALGSVVKGRINESVQTLEEMKDKEIKQAIALLQSVKEGYEKNKAEIIKEVRIQEKLLPWRQYIDWAKVNEMIENSIDWNKVVALIKQNIPRQNVDKIKTTQNQAKISEYRTLVKFLMGKLNSQQKTEVGYIAYWNTSTPLANLGRLIIFLILIIILIIVLSN